MNAQEIQVLELAGAGASVDEISSELRLESATVKFILTKNGMLKEDEVTDEDFNDIRDSLLQLAKFSENEFVKARVGMFLYERKKGATSSLKGAPQVNIGNLNLLIAASHKKIINALNYARSNNGGIEGTAAPLQGQPQDKLPEAGGDQTIAAPD